MADSATAAIAIATASITTSSTPLLALPGGRALPGLPGGKCGPNCASPLAGEARELLVASALSAAGVHWLAEAAIPHSALQLGEST